VLNIILSQIKHFKIIGLALLLHFGVEGVENALPHPWVLCLQAPGHHLNRKTQQASLHWYKTA
jgi:hypothetical protein